MSHDSRQHPFSTKKHAHQERDDRMNAHQTEPQTSSSTSASILRLQRTIGNQAVMRMLGAKKPQETESAKASTAVSQDSPGLLRRFTNLGQFEVNQRIYDSKVFPLKVGSTDEWIKLLEDMDDEDEYTEHLAAFLWLANDPMLLKKGQHRMGDKFITMPSRAPSDKEKLDFVRALYKTGKKLDLPDNFSRLSGGDDEGGIYVFDLRAGLAGLIRDYGAQVIAESGNQHIDPTSVSELANEGGQETRSAMLESAAATAFKGVDLYVTALNIIDDRKRDVEKMIASETIRNAGRVIRLTLKEHDAAVKAREDALGQIFDHVWGAIPGGDTLTSIGKTILGQGFKAQFQAAAKIGDPEEQMEAMNINFVNHVNKLVGNEQATHGAPLTAADANAIINGFEAVRR